MINKELVSVSCMYVYLLPLIPLAIILLILMRRKRDEPEIKVVRLKDIKSKGVLAEIEEELEEFEELEEEEEGDKRFDEIVIADGFGEILFTTGKDTLVDPFYVFPYADRVIVESDKCETFVKLENGFIYIKAKRPVDVRVARRVAKKIIKDRREERLSKIIS